MKLKTAPFIQINELSHSVTFKINDKQLAGVGGGDVGINIDLRKVLK